nr:biopolymer transporter ExbD [uncultured Cohaesibacter sp.]
MTKILWKSSRKRPKFALTSLVDVIFLLLIFFMLATNTAPYSLLDLSTRPNSTQSEEKHQTAAKLASHPNTSSALLRLTGGRILLDRQSYSIDSIDEVIEALKSGKQNEIQIILGQKTPMQNVTSLLEGLKLAHMKNVTLLRRANETN